MDGVKSLAVQGHSYGERQFTDAQRRSGRGFGKMTSQEVGEGGIMSKDREESVCVCVRKGETEANRETLREKREVYWREFGERARRRCTDKEIQEMFVTERKKNRTLVGGRDQSKKTNQTSSARSSSSTPFNMVALF